MSTPAAPSTPASSADGPSAAVPSAAGTTDHGPRPIPTRPRPRVTSLQVPSIGLATGNLERLRLGSDGKLQAPRNPQRAGWYVDSAVPGATGPAIIAGHIDSVTGPAVFYRLAQIRPGAAIHIGLSNGQHVTFVVDTVLHAGKHAFPTDRVYGPTPDPQLRLITCAGPYLRSAGGYQDNTIVLATLKPATKNTTGTRKTTGTKKHATS